MNQDSPHFWTTPTLHGDTRQELLKVKDQATGGEPWDEACPGGQGILGNNDMGMSSNNTIFMLLD